MSFSDGSLQLFDLRDRSGDIMLVNEGSGFSRFSGGFERQYFAAAASNLSESVFVVVDTDGMVQTFGLRQNSPSVAYADEHGIFMYIDNRFYMINPTNGDMVISRREKEYDSDFLELAAGVAVIGNSDSPIIRIMRYVSREYATVFSYDVSFPHMEARISADWQRVMLFSFRGFRLYIIDGDLLSEVHLQNVAHIHNVLFIRGDGDCYLTVIYNDGTVRNYSAVDGSFIYETVGELPDLTLFEVFFTDTFKIESPLHGTPRAYDVATGDFFRELERDAFLTHVTQIGDYVLTEYLTIGGERFGLLLDSELDVVAYLPFLSDFIGGYLIFNCLSGNLRKSRIYTVDELIEIALGTPQ